jgi:hypothetical protein
MRLFGRAASVALVIGFVASLSPATITIDGNSADWAGKLMNLDATDRPGNLDVANWGCIVDTSAGMAYFAQTFEFDAVTEFAETGEGIWANWWLDLDRDNETGHGGWQMQAVGWAENTNGATNQGIDVGVEVGHYEADDFALYYTNGSDCWPKEPYVAAFGQQYPKSNDGQFAFSEDGKFLEVCVSIEELIRIAGELSQIDTSVYGDFDADAAATGLWEVGTRIDGKDTSLGIGYATQTPVNPAGHEGLVTLPVVTGDANLDGVVDVIDLGLLATNYGGSTDIIWNNGDFNADGVVDVIDLGLLATYYGSGSLHGVQTPEPTTLGLLALGALGIIRRRRSA